MWLVMCRPVSSGFFAGLVGRVCWCVGVCVPLGGVVLVVSWCQWLLAVGVRGAFVVALEVAGGRNDSVKVLAVGMVDGRVLVG